MDPMERVELQTKIRFLRDRAHKDLSVLALLDQAIKAMDARKWDSAKDLFAQAESSFVDEVELLAAVVVKGFAKNRAQARRLVENGKICVNGDVVPKSSMLRTIRTDADISLSEV